MSAFPKILVLSHTCFSKSDAMGSTLQSYFLSYDKEFVAQFFIKKMMPSFDVCSNYFFLSDKDAFKMAITPFYRKRGKIFTSKKDDDLPSNINSIRTVYTTKHRSFALLIRNLVWNLAFFNYKKFFKWVDEFSPEVILCQPGDFPFLFKLAIKLKKKYEIPIIIHQSETYYLKPYKKGLLYKIYRKKFNKAFKELMDNSSASIYLSEAIKEDYDKLFNLPSYCIMKGSTIVADSDNESKSTDNRKLSFVYAGNIDNSVGRAQSLAEFGKELLKHDLFLDVYSSSSDYDKDVLCEKNGIRFHGEVTFDELKIILSKTDFIVHVESFEPDKIIDLKYAFSTKIADMLACGCCPFVYGPLEISSISYFYNHKTAFVAKEKKELGSAIKLALDNPDLVTSIKNNAHSQFLSFHDPIKNSKLFNHIVKNVVKKVN